MDIIEEKIQQIVTELEAKKEAIFKEKLAERGLSHLLNDIEKKKFKPILIEKHPDWTHYYADNGTNEGLRIVSFKTMEPTFDWSGDKAIGSVEIVYQ